MRQPKKLKLPATVLERAKAIAATTAKKPLPPELPKQTAPLKPRDKVIAALKKLHPMD